MIFQNKINIFFNNKIVSKRYNSKCSKNKIFSYFYFKIKYSKKIED